MALTFIPDPDAIAGKCYHPYPGLKRVLAPNPGPFTYTGTGTYLLGTDQIAVIDPGPDNDDHLSAILSAADAPISHILVTHTHRDHSPLSLKLKAETGAEIWGCKPIPQHGHTAQFEEALDDTYAPDHIMQDGDILKGAGWSLEAIETPGHISNHICFHWAEENALFCGDHVMSWSTSVILPPDGDMAAYLQSLQKIKSRRFKALWPTHGQPITEVDTFLSALIQHRLDRETAILITLDEGPRAIMDIVKLLYQDIPETLYPAAAQSVFAHLIKLGNEGLVESANPPRIDGVYARKSTNR